MKILLVAGRVSRLPWSSGGLVLEVCKALHRRGHELTLMCHDLDDEEGFDGIARTIAMRRFSTGLSDWPLGFAAFARRWAPAQEFDASLSFSRVVAGDVWMPIEPSAESWLEQRRVTSGPVGIAKSLLRHHGVLRAGLVEAHWRVPPSIAASGTRGRASPGAIQRIVMVGATAAGEAARHLASSGLDTRVLLAPAFSMLGVQEPERVKRDRAAVRVMLGIAEQQRVILATSTAYAGRALVPLLAGVLEASKRDARLAPLLLVLTKDPVAQHTWAARLGGLGHVRIMGLTHRPEAALAACDVVALPVRAPRGAFEAGATGRLAGDALRAGRPLLALSGAPGYELARQMLEDSSRPGVVVDVPTPEAWGRGVREIFEPMVYAQVSRAAQHLGAAMGFSPLVDALEGALSDAARRA